MKICPMFSQLPLLLCVYHSVCVDPLMSVSQASYSHRRSLAFDSVSSLGQIQGAHSGEVKCKKKEKKINIRLNVQRDALIPQGTDSQREITQLVVSMWKSLHFIFLIEPPAAPTSRAGPAYQDLKGLTAAATKNHNSQDWPVRVQTQVPEAKRGEGGIYFHLPVSLSLSPVLHNSTGN